MTIFSSIDNFACIHTYFSDRLLVEVYRDSELRLESMAAPDAPRAYRFKLAAGTLFADVDPATEVVSIESDKAVIQAPSTKFWVHDRPGEITWVLSQENEVFFTAEGQTVTVAAGYQSWVRPGEPPHEPVPANRGEIGDLIPPLLELTGGEKGDEDVFPTPVPTAESVATAAPAAEEAPVEAEPTP